MPYVLARHVQPQDVAEDFIVRGGMHSYAHFLVDRYFGFSASNFLLGFARLLLG